MIVDEFINKNTLNPPILQLSRGGRNGVTYGQSAAFFMEKVDYGTSVARSALRLQLVWTDIIRFSFNGVEFMNARANTVPYLKAGAAKWRHVSSRLSSAKH